MQTILLYCLPYVMGYKDLGLLTFCKQYGTEWDIRYNRNESQLITLSGEVYGLPLICISQTEGLRPPAVILILLSVKYIISGKPYTGSTK